MTQLDLPPVSLQRYLELLKRRRWQVVPISLVGLVIGALVAFFVPRWFVAETRLQYEHGPDAPAVRVEDPFARIVDTAKSTMPLAAEAVMRKLGWPEVAERDLYALQQNVRGVQQRIVVHDHNAGEKGRSYAQLHVTYRDRDGKRAAAFLNTLVGTWVNARLDEIRRRAEDRLERANDGYNSAVAVHEGLRREIEELQREHELEPVGDPAVYRDRMRERDREQSKRQQTIEKLESEVAALDAAARTAEQAFETAPKYVPPSELEKREDLFSSPLARGMFERMVVVQISLQSVMGPAHKDRPARERELALLREKLAALVSQYGQELGPGGEVPNPQRADLRKAADQARIAFAQRDAELRQLRLQAEAEERDKERLLPVYNEYERKLTQLREAEKKRDLASTSVEEARNFMGRLANDQTIEVIAEAVVPPRPTEPNIVLVALLGSLMGLGAAVALILLLDVMQGTFKTVEDVERGLPVPVLGSVSHLETVEERKKVVAGRRRASLLAGAVVLLVVVVVTVYYVDPTRLPPFARDLLAIVLGG